LDCKLLPDKGYERLERYDWKLSRTVLRRGGASNRPSLFGVKEPRVVMLLFSTGKIVCTGARNVEDVSRAVDKLSEDLNSLGLLH